MATKSKILEKQDRERDAAFNTAMHGEASGADGGFRAMLRKGGGSAAQRAATEEYFKHWDNQAAKDETEETRAVSSTSSCERGSYDPFSYHGPDLDYSSGTRKLIVTLCPLETNR